MIELLLFLFLVAVIAIMGFAVYRHFYRSSPLAASLAVDRPQAETVHLLVKAVRLLELGLNDPMYRQSVDWTDKARQIVASYYLED